MVARKSSGSEYNIQINTKRKGDSIVSFLNVNPQTHIIPERYYTAIIILFAFPPNKSDMINNIFT